tara:strand:+ start:579 stop:1133 length:555 start_codon:yes stop_codon:yes gene_type:complete
MSRNKKWSSNDKNQLLVENFRNFMEEGDFSPDEGEVDEGWVGRMAGAVTGKNKKAAQMAQVVFKKFKPYIEQYEGNISKALSAVSDEMGSGPLEEVGVESYRALFQQAGMGEWLDIAARRAKQEAGKARGDLKRSVKADAAEADEKYLEKRYGSKATRAKHGSSKNFDDPGMRQAQAHAAAKEK